MRNPEQMSDTEKRAVIESFKRGRAEGLASLVEGRYHFPSRKKLERRIAQTFFAKPPKKGRRQWSKDYARMMRAQCAEFAAMSDEKLVEAIVEELLGDHDEPCEKHDDYDCTCHTPWVPEILTRFNSDPKYKAFLDAAWEQAMSECGVKRLALVTDDDGNVGVVESDDPDLPELGHTNLDKVHVRAQQIVDEKKTHPGTPAFNAAIEAYKVQEATFGHVYTAVAGEMVRKHRRGRK